MKTSPCFPGEGGGKRFTSYLVQVTQRGARRACARRACARAAGSRTMLLWPFFQVDGDNHALPSLTSTMI